LPLEGWINVIPQSFDFPDYFGRNWDSALDCLRDACEEGRLVIVRDAHVPAAVGDVGRIVATLQTAGRHVGRDDVAAVLEGYRARRIAVRFTNRRLDSKLPVRPLPI
jgi:hypothetical protein